MMMRIAMMTMMITRADVTRPLGRGVHRERERESQIIMMMTTLIMMLVLPISCR